MKRRNWLSLEPRGGNRSARRAVIWRTSWVSGEFHRDSPFGLRRRLAPSPPLPRTGQEAGGARSRRAYDPLGACTVTLCTERKFSSFCSMLLLVCGPISCSKCSTGGLQLLPHAIQSAAEAVRSFVHSSCAKSLWYQNCAELPRILATSQMRFFKATFASSSPATPATQSGSGATHLWAHLAPRVLTPSRLRICRPSASRLHNARHGR